MTAAAISSGEPGSSFARWLFFEPEARTLIVNWPDFAAAAAVGALRYEQGRHPRDRHLAEQIDEFRRRVASTKVVCDGLVTSEPRT